MAKTDLILKEMQDAKETYVKLRDQCEHDESDNMRHEVIVMPFIDRYHFAFFGGGRGARDFEMNISHP